MMGLKISGLKEAWQNEEVRSISRRYFISNGFDGTLTATGIAVGSYLSGVPEGATVFKVGVGAAIGLATSGIWSVWEIERAEKLAELQDVEDSMLRDLKETEVHEKKERGRVVNSVMSGLGPMLAVMLTVSPFLVEGVGLNMLQAAVSSVAIGMLLLSTFGAYMASISSQKAWRAALRMGLAGLVVALLNLVLPG